MQPRCPGQAWIRSFWMTQVASSPLLQSILVPVASATRDSPQQKAYMKAKTQLVTLRIHSKLQSLLFEIRGISSAG